MTATDKLAEALRHAVAGLEWFHDRYPLVVDESDYELLEQAEEALAAHDAEQAQEAQQPAGQEQDERAAFEAWFSGFRHGWKSEKEVASDAWRAALAQRREPLTDAEIEEILHGEIALNPGDGCAGRFARAIERAHGIGATTGKEPGNV